jgi:hypothetical protein
VLTNKCSLGLLHSDQLATLFRRVHNIANF